LIGVKNYGRVTRVAAFGLHSGNEKGDRKSVPRLQLITNRAYGLSLCAKVSDLERSKRI